MKPLIALLFPVFLLAQSAPQSAGSIQPDVKEIVRRSLDRDLRNFDRLNNYVYEIREVERSYDSKNNVKKTKVTVKEILQVDGSRYERLIEEDGKPLPPARAAKEQQKLDKELARRRAESESQRQKRIAADAKRDRDMRKMREEIIQAFDFTAAGVESVNGFPCWKVKAEPRAGFQSKSSFGKVLEKMRGTLWIGQGNYEWLRVDAETLDKVTFGGFLVSVNKGARFQIWQMRINDELFAPQRIEASVNLRALVTRIRAASEVEFRNYRKFSTESRIISTGEAAPR